MKQNPSSLLVFTRVNVLISGDAIQVITFLLRETIRVGDLEMFFKTHSFQGTPHTMFFSWRGSFGSASMVADREGFSLFRRVWQVTFSDTPLTWHIKRSTRLKIFTFLQGVSHK